MEIGLAANFDQDREMVDSVDEVKSVDISNYHQ